MTEPGLVSDAPSTTPDDPARVATLAILGGGQLGRMLALSAVHQGVRARVLEPDPTCPAAACAEVIDARWDDEAAIARLVDGAGALTYEFENVPVEPLRSLSLPCPLRPGVRSLEVAQDRLVEKTFFASHDVPVQRFEAVESLGELQAAVESIGRPSVLKTRRLGYDGKGQCVIRHDTDLVHAWQSVGEVPSILEAFVPFVAEASVVVVRTPKGETATWPICENRHEHGILRTTTAPAAHPAVRQVADLARAHAARLAEALDHVGVITVEFFVVQDADGSASIVANECAPRVHNSGHWTIEGARTSQFENHVRAVLDRPLGDTSANGWCAMVNIVGTVPDVDAILAVPGTHVHLYGKEPRARRKLGHVTIVRESDAELAESLARVEALVPSW